MQQNTSQSATVPVGSKFNVAIYDLFLRYNNFIAIPNIISSNISLTEEQAFWFISKHC